MVPSLGGARLKRMRVELRWTVKYWLLDADILKRLRKCREEGMNISITIIGTC